MSNSASNPLRSTIENRNALSAPICIVADDMTGACDTGAPFAARGAETRVWWRFVELPVAPWGRESVSRETLSTQENFRRETDSRPLSRDASQSFSPEDRVTVLCTNSRNDDPPVAARKVADACHWFNSQWPAVVYKKIDSTLRGNVGTEIDALLEVSQASRAIICPAFPAMNRVLIDGQLESPGVTIHLPNLLQRQSSHHITRISRTTVANGPSHLAEVLEATADELLVIDAATEADLATIVAGAYMLSPLPVFVGSAGLANHLAETLLGKMEREKRLRGPQQNAPHSKSVVFFVGSNHSVTLGQLDRLCERLPTAQICLGESSDVNISQVLAVGHTLVVQVPWNRPDLDPTLRSLIESVSQSHPCGIVLSGGDTAVHVLDVAGANSLHLMGELETGVPLSQCHGGLLDGFSIVTKAGGFGRPNTFCNIPQYLNSLK